MFETLRKPLSPVGQDFIWLADYADGTHLSEYDFVTKKENSFYAIDKSKLIRFGLVGQNQRLYFDYDGIFYLNGVAVEAAYVADQEYVLTGHMGKYQDIIQYKDAESVVNLMGGGVRSQVTQYNFGYKTVLSYGDVVLNFQSICHVPSRQPVYFTFRLVANQNLNGTFAIKRNNRIVQEIPAPLTKGVGGEANWVVS